MIEIDYAWASIHDNGHVITACDVWLQQRFPHADPVPSENAGDNNLNSFFLCSVRTVMYKYLEERKEITFDKIFGQKLGKLNMKISFAYFILYLNKYYPVCTHLLLLVSMEFMGFDYPHSPPSQVQF